ncbi:hypothetical protein ACHHYP_13040 [Achlya hypogyna]|uniref:Uncharacterized protein n=1 Tax=Achlya hypogyna TaxID=1202772 RepID=A0A1V9YG70_ACHHY|nr:hypothetical protein ACHHYP_13040 [Achlya hypogyna]
MHQDDEAADEDLLAMLPAAGNSLAFLDASSSIPKRKRTRVNRLAQEVSTLREEALRLQDSVALWQLQRLGCPRMMKEASRYGRLAIQQKALKDKALREQAELRALLDEHIAFRAFLEKALLKRPRSMMLKVGNSKWRNLSLGTTAEARIAAIHAIADRQHELMESEMLAKGLYEPSADVFAVETSAAAGRIASEARRATVLATSLANTVVAAVDLMRERHAMISANGDNFTYCSSQVYEIDGDTTYIRSTFAPPNGPAPLTSSVITKKYDDEAAGGVAIVWRSILEDDGIPHTPGSFVNDEYGWYNQNLRVGQVQTNSRMYFERDNEKHTKYKAYVCATSPIAPPNAQSDQLVELMRVLHVDAMAPGGGALDDIVTTVRSSFQQMIAQFERQVVQRAFIEDTVTK